jgi:hypothetical protein
MNQIPDDMHYCSVHLLNPMDAVGRYDETAQTASYQSRNIFCSQRDMNQIPETCYKSRKLTPRYMV